MEVSVGLQMPWPWPWALGSGCWVLGSRFAGLLAVPEPLSLPSLPVRD